MTSVDSQIRASSSTISANIDVLADDRGLLSRNVLKQLRDLVEAVAVRMHLGEGDVEFNYHPQVKPAIAWTGSTKRRTTSPFIT